MQVYKTSIKSFIVLFTVLFAGVISAANISVKTDRQTIVINESFQLIFEADGSVDRDPDFSPLNKDFQVLSTSVSSNMSIINGRISSTKQWQLTVLVRREGRLTVPAISFGKDKSPAATITVAKAGARGGAGQRNDADIFLEVEADILKPYVQAQVLYTIKLYRSVNIANASLTDPEVSGGDAVIERLGEDQNYETWVQGKRFLVVERNYALYPQVSDKLTIAPIRFQGQLARDRFSTFGPFGSQGKTIIRQSKPVTLDVQAIPDAFAGGHWLPSKNVSLIEQWSENPMQLRAGEPVTRTLVITAEGQTGSQLPELPLWSLSGVKQYPDQASLSDDKNQTGITGTRQEKMAIILNQPGKYTLPEIRLPWWNTEKNRLEYAELPAREITVLGAAGSQSDLLSIAPPQIGDITSPVPEDFSRANPSLPGQEEVSATNTAKSSRTWQYISLALALAWITTLLLWWRGRKLEVRGKQEDTADLAIRQVIKEIKQACSEDDPARTKELLLQWGRLNWQQNPPTSISEIGSRCSDALANQIRLLSDCLYSANRQSWHGKVFWEAFEKEKKLSKKESQKEAGKLEPLYKL